MRTSPQKTNNKEKYPRGTVYAGEDKVKVGIFEDLLISMEDVLKISWKNPDHNKVKVHELDKLFLITTLIPTFLFISLAKESKKKYNRNRNERKRQV